MMQHYLDLLTIKSKSDVQQKEIIARTVGLLANSPDLPQLRRLAGEELDRADDLSNADLIILWILVTYAADIGTVPLRESRDYHLTNLDDLAAQYNMPSKTIRRLSVHGDFALRWFDERLSRAA